MERGEGVAHQDNWHTRGFFGLHFDLHANEHDEALGKDATVAHICAELSKTRPDFVQYDCKGHPGYAGYPTKVGTPAPGIARDALKVWREATRKLGIPLVVHYSALWDGAAAAKHPQWTVVGPDGTRDKEKLCSNGPYTRELMIPQMLEVIDWYDVDGFWVDGDNWCALPCYCGQCVGLFQSETGVKGIPRAAGEPGWDAWLQFHRRSFERHVREYMEAVHERKPDCLVCSNWMYAISQPEEMSVAVDYLSGDFSPSFGCEHAAGESRFLDGRGLSWNLMAWGFFRVDFDHSGWTCPGWTFKTPDHLKQEAAEVIANGGNVVIYDVPQRTGRLVSWHQDILAEVAGFCRARQEFCQGTESIPQVAVLHNSPDYYAKNRPLYVRGSAAESLDGAVQALLENHYHTDILNDAALIRRMGEYPVVVLPEPLTLSGDLVGACREYVSQGGNLVVSGPRAASLLGDLLGVEATGEPETAEHCLAVDGEMVGLKGLWQTVEPKKAQVVGFLHVGKELSAGRTDKPAATLSHYGKGRAVGIYGPVFEFFCRSHYPRLRKWVGSVLDGLPHPKLLKVTAPARVEVSLRRKQGKILVHLVNRGAGHPLSPRNHAVEDIPPVGPIQITLPLPAKPTGVYLAPDQAPLTFSWTDGRLEVEIGSLSIHNVLVIEQWKNGKM